MRGIMLELMRVTANLIVAHEHVARRFAEEAATAERSGDPEAASLMGDLARQHRVKALELDGQLAGWRQEYALRFG